MRSASMVCMQCRNHEIRLAGINSFTTITTQDRKTYGTPCIHFDIPICSQLWTSILICITFLFLFLRTTFYSSYITDHIYSLGIAKYLFHSETYSNHWCNLFGISTEIWLYFYICISTLHCMRVHLLFLYCMRDREMALTWRTRHLRFSPEGRGLSLNSWPGTK